MFNDPLEPEVLTISLECESRWVRVDPGGYKLTPDKLNAGDGSLAKMLKGVVEKENEANPRAQFSPKLKILVLRGGEKTYWSTMRQIFISGLDWPLEIANADSNAPRLPKLEPIK